MSQKYDVLLVGDYFLDLVFTGLPRQPELGQEVFASGFDMVPGGAYNSAVALHRLGVGVAWAADFGNDEFSRRAAGDALREGMDDRWFVHHSRPYRRITVAASYPDERSFITFIDPEPALPAGMRALAQLSARLLLVAGFYRGALFAPGQLLARLHGMQLAMDGNGADGMLLSDPGTRAVLRRVQLFMPNATEARSLTGETEIPAAAEALACCCPLAVVKDGPNGSYASDGCELLHAAPLDVVPLDTTGAGDCYNAGFVAARLRGLPVAECLRWGNVTGALSTLGYGGTGRRVEVEEVERLLAGGACPVTRIRP